MVGLVVFVGVSGVFVVAVVLFVGLASHRDRPSTATAEDNDSTIVDAGPSDPGILPARTPIDRANLDRTAEAQWGVARCSGGSGPAPMSADNPERRSTYTGGYIALGTAQRMRGRVGVVHLLLSSPTLPWTLGRARDVSRSALLAGRFFEKEANKYEVRDLEYLPMAWTLSSTFAVPELAIDPTSRRISTESSHELVRRALRASEGALGVTLSAVADGLKKEGFAETAFLLHIPKKISAREFALPAWKAGELDVAVIFEEELGWEAFTVAHEAMHLFGADDLYPLELFDDRDKDDLMRGGCYGFSNELGIKDMSAYAIGWKSARPARIYGFKR